MKLIRPWTAATAAVTILFLLFSPLAFAENDSSSQKITLELQDVSILDVLKILSKKSGLNIVAGKSIQGQVSIFLREVPVFEALKTILASQGLAAVKEGEVTKIITEQEYLEKYGRPYEDKRVTKSFRLLYARADQLAGQLATLKSPYGKVLLEPQTNTLVITEIPEVLQDMEVVILESEQPQETELVMLQYARAEELEPRLKSFQEGTAGKLEIDKRTNQIIITDIRSRIDRLKGIIQAFDVQMPQVLIEAKIVEVRLGDGFRQGINWQHIAQQAGNVELLKAAAPLAVAPPLGALSLSTFALGAKNIGIDIILDLLEKVGKTNLLSTPRIVVLNNEEAKIAVGTRQPFVSQTIIQTVNSTNTADNVQFVDVGVSLKVQPRISQDDYVEMKIKPEVSSSNETVELQSVAPGSDTVFTRTSIPVVTTQELETSVRVKSGTTLVVGGLIQDREEKQTSKIPIVGSIPLLGRLFHSKSHDFTKTELVVFLTPTIIRPYEQPDSKAEEARFFNPESQMLPFNIYGGYPYTTTYSDPKRYARTGEVPYWEDPREYNGPFKPLNIPASDLQPVNTPIQETHTLATQ